MKPRIAVMFGFGSAQQDVAHRRYVWCLELARHNKTSRIAVMFDFGSAQQDVAHRRYVWLWLGAKRRRSIAGKKFFLSSGSWHASASARAHRRVPVLNFFGTSQHFLNFFFLIYEYDNHTYVSTIPIGVTVVGACPDIIYIQYNSIRYRYRQLGPRQY